MSIFDDVKPVHGLFGDQAKVARGAPMGNLAPSGFIAVRLWDRTNEESAIAGFTPEQARVLAKRLVEAADTMETARAE